MPEAEDKIAKIWKEYFNFQISQPAVQGRGGSEQLRSHWKQVSTLQTLPKSFSLESQSWVFSF